MPLLYVTDPLSKEVTIYTGEIETEAIQAYLTEFIDGQTKKDKSEDRADNEKANQHKPEAIQFFDLEPLLERAGVTVTRSRSELDDLILYKGQDVCVFYYSTA